MKKLLFMTLLILFIARSTAWANNIDVATEITWANIHYQNKQYNEAINIYDRLVAEGYANGHLYYNLGNAHFRLGETGHAIYNYLKAKTLIPRDKDLDANLKSAFQETTDHLEEKHANNILFFWLNDFNFQESIQALVIINLIFWISLAGWIYFRTGFWDLARKTMLCLLILAAITAVAKYHANTRSIYGVVLAKTADIQSTPEPDNVTLFQLHEGAVVSITEKKDDWYKIELPDEKKGWIKKESIGI